MCSPRVGSRKYANSTNFGKEDRTVNPTVGRSVHFTPVDGGEPLAAIVTAVETVPTRAGRAPSGRVSLCVLQINGMSFGENVSFATESTPGCWHWPPRF